MTKPLRCFALAVASSCLFAVGCSSLPGPVETTDDGLVRVPSRKLGGVYRAPGAPFTQYKKLIVEPLTVGFVRDWEKNNPDVDATEIKRIRVEAQKIFSEEFTEELIKDGKYQFADAPGPDVLLINPAVVDYDLVVPDASAEVTRVYTPGPPKMQLTAELRDAATGTLVGRVTMFEGGERYAFDQMRVANRATNAHYARIGYEKFVRLIREALNVAKVERPRKTEAQRGGSIE